MYYSEIAKDKSKLCRLQLSLVECIQMMRYLGYIKKMEMYIYIRQRH